MRVANILDHFLPANLGLVYDQIIETQNLGVEHLVLCLKRRNETTFPFDPTFAFHSLNPFRKNLVRLIAKARGDSDAYAYFAKVLGDKKADLLHSHFIWTAEDSARLKARFGLPLVLTLYGEDAIKSTQDAESSLRLRRILSACDAIVAVSRYVEECALRIGTGGIAVRTIVPGVDVQKFKPLTYRTGAGEKIVIGTAARLEAVKGVEVLLDSLVTEDMKRDFVLRIAGSGSQETELRNTVAKLGLGGTVEFCGWIPRERMPAFYNSLDIFVLPSIILESGITEAAGMVLLEAQACGVPVVASGVGGIPEFIVDGKTGLLVPPNDSGALRSALQVLGTDPALRMRMGSKSTSLVAEKFSLSSTAMKLVEVYKSVLR